jgi:hypothetical protein
MVKSWGILGGSYHVSDFQSYFRQTSKTTTAFLWHSRFGFIRRNIYGIVRFIVDDFLDFRVEKRGFIFRPAAWARKPLDLVILPHEIVECMVDMVIALLDNFDVIQVKHFDFIGKL